MHRWTKVKFKEIFGAPLKNGLNKPSRIRGEGYKMVNMGEIFAYDKIGEQTMERVPMTKNEMQNSFLDEGDLLFARQSLIASGAGKCSIFLGSKERVTYEGHLIRARLNRELADPLFYYYYFTSKVGRSKIETIIQQVAAAGIRGSELSELEIDWVDVENQKKISLILSSLDNKVDLNVRINSTLEQIATTLFKEYFIADDDVDNFQNSWTQVTLKEFIKTTTGCSYKSSELKQSNNALVTLKNFDRDGGFKLNGFKEYIGRCKDSHVVVEGDLVVAHTDVTQNAELIGNPIIIINPFNYKTLLISTDLVKVEILNKHVSGIYLYYLMLNADFKNHCLGYTNGTTVLHLSKSALGNYKFNLPPASLIKTFTNQVNSIRERINCNIKENINLTSTRNVLLHKIMAGEEDLLTVHQNQ